MVQTLVGAVFLGLSSFVFASCVPENFTSLERIKVTRVYDGDTIGLTDKRKVRLLGFNAPETRKYKPEPFSSKARKQLKRLVLGKYVFLKTDTEQYDKYQRLLANIFLADGTNISETMLKSGLGQLLIIPPNIEFADCYKKAQNHAEKNRLNIFAGKYKLRFSTKTGVVKKIKNTRASTWIYLDNKKYIRISNDDKPHFAKICFSCLKGKKIRANGWWKKSGNGLRLRLFHPLMMDVMHE